MTGQPSPNPPSILQFPGSIIRTLFSTMKRLFDILVSALALFILSPLFLVITALIKLDSPGPVFFQATRVGKDGKPFRLYKFRNMVVDAAKSGPKITTHGDARVTSVGRWLRKHKVDELPQLFNILKGEMSLVGPRPEDPRYVAQYTQEHKKVLSVLPGITSPASVRFRHEERLLNSTNLEDTYFQIILPEKLKIDLDYIQRRTFATDLLIIWQTVLALFR